MPTPDDTVASPPSPSLDPVISETFTTCPPEEQRETHPPLDEDGIGTTEAHRPNGTAREEEMPVQEAAVDADAASRSIATEEDGPRKSEGKQDDDGSIETSPQRLESPDAPSDSGNDASLAQSMSMAAINAREKKEDDEQKPRYIWYPPMGEQRSHPHSVSSFLHAGSKFRGTQRSDHQVYDVQVEIKDVNLSESFLCGYLRIQGLTDDHPTLTTFFEGEIVGAKHGFHTTHQSWGATEKIDLVHWSRFPSFKSLARLVKANPTNFRLKNALGREHLFMRWKEYFLVPDHRVKSISGASFEGFYYICFNQCAGTVSGIYFHAKSEKYQQLELRHVDDGGCMGAIEFR